MPEGAHHSRRSARTSARAWPEDAKEAIGHGVRARRSKSGAISFDVLELEDSRAALQGASGLRQLTIYLLLPLLAFLDFAASANSIRRRIASEREGLSFCCLAQFSTANLRTGASRKVMTGSRPVAGRPGLFGVTFSVDDLAMFW